MFCWSMTRRTKVGYVQLHTVGADLIVTFIRKALRSATARISHYTDVSVYASLHTRASAVGPL